MSRLIPARAGNTEPGALVVRIQPAHPRSRGEHEMMRRLNRPDTGSSPLARGTLSVFLSVIIGFRLIPARAGNTTLAACA